MNKKKEELDDNINLKCIKFDQFDKDDELQINLLVSIVNIRCDIF